MGDLAGVLSFAEFDGLLRGIEQRFSEAERQAQCLIDNIHDALDFLGPAGDRINDLLAQLWSIIRRLGSEIAKFITQPGIPWTLWSHGNDWSGEPIGGRVSGLVGKSTLDETRADELWQGPAADAYRNALPRQKEALAALVTTAHAIDDVLTKMAIAIGAFWLAVAAAVLALLVELTGESAAASTGVGAPAAAAAAGLSVAKALSIIATAAGAVYAFVVADTLPAIKDLRQQLYNRTAFPNGRWPRSTTDFSDGSLSDGDGTGWRLKM